MSRLLRSSSLDPPAPAKSAGYGRIRYTAWATDLGLELLDAPWTRWILLVVGLVILKGFMPLAEAESEEERAGVSALATVLRNPKLVVSLRALATILFLLAAVAFARQFLANHAV